MRPVVVVLFKPLVNDALLVQFVDGNSAPLDALFLQGADEETLIHSGLEDTMINAVAETRNTARDKVSFRRLSSHYACSHPTFALFVPPEN